MKFCTTLRWSKLDSNPRSRNRDHGFFANVARPRGPGSFTRGNDGSIFLHFDPGAARPIGRAASVQSQEYRTGAEGLARFAVRGIVMGSITAPSSERTDSRVDQIDE
jgi:hypothetical protein